MNLNFFFPKGKHQLPQIRRHANQLCISFHGCLQEDTQVSLPIPLLVPVRLLPSLQCQILQVPQTAEVFSRRRRILLQGHLQMHVQVLGEAQSPRELLPSVLKSPSLHVVCSLDTNWLDFRKIFWASFFFTVI